MLPCCRFATIIGGLLQIGLIRCYLWARVSTCVCGTLSLCRFRRGRLGLRLELFAPSTAEAIFQREAAYLHLEDSYTDLRPARIHRCANKPTRSKPGALIRS